MLAGSLDCALAVGHHETMSTNRYRSINSLMMRIGRHWGRLGIAAVLLVLGLVGFARLRAWNDLGELRLAQEEIARGQLAAAQKRLTSLAARPGALAGAADYWLGICEALGGRPDAALRLCPPTRRLRV